MSRIMVRTLPLGNGNYGGILQAFALQHVLSKLGGSSVVDLSRSDERTGTFATLKALAKRVLMIFGYERPHWAREATRGANVALEEFADSRIATMRLYGPAGRPNPAILQAFDGFVTGSDQVWRRAYGDVRSYLFDFLPDSDVRPRISYAASFGHDTLDEYEPDLVDESGRLARRFDALSVREASGVRLARDSWGVRAEHHVDPTLLLEPGDYLRLAAEATDAIPPNQLLDYVLDETPPTRTVVSRVATTLGQTPFSLIPPAPSYRQYRRNPDRYRKSSIEAWLGAISGARFVVTDSFHGTVFSILHNVPFIAVVNHARGVSRFESLLDTFGLRKRLIDSNDAAVDVALATPIDWEFVNTRIEQERERSISYLRRALFDPRR